MRAAIAGLRAPAIRSSVACDSGGEEAPQGIQVAAGPRVRDRRHRLTRRSVLQGGEPLVDLQRLVDRRAPDHGGALDRDRLEERQVLACLSRERGQYRLERIVGVESVPAGIEQGQPRDDHQGWHRLEAFPRLAGAGGLIAKAVEQRRG